MNTEIDQGLSAQETEQILQAMNSERANDLLLYAQVYGKQSGAKSASLVRLHEDSMELELEFLYSTPKRLSIQFSEPIKDAKDALLHFDQLAQKAHEILGHTDNEPLGRTVYNMLPEWMKH